MCKSSQGSRPSDFSFQGGGSAEEQKSAGWFEFVWVSQFGSLWPWDVVRICHDFGTTQPQKIGLCFCTCNLCVRCVYMRGVYGCVEILLYFPF